MQTVPLRFQNNVCSVCDIKCMSWIETPTVQFHVTKAVRYLYWSKLLLTVSRSQSGIQRNNDLSKKGQGQSVIKCSYFRPGDKSGLTAFPEIIYNPKDMIKWAITFPKGA